MKLPISIPSFRTVMDVAGYLRTLAGSAQGGWNVEHREDGTHRIDWRDATFDAADFTMNTGTWTVDRADVLLYQYAQLGTLTLVQFNVQSTTISAGAGNELRLRIPGRIRAKHKESTGILFISGADNGPQVSYCVTRDDNNGGADRLGLFRNNNGAWNASTNVTGVRGFIAFESETY